MTLTDPACGVDPFTPSSGSPDGTERSVIYKGQAGYNPLLLAIYDVWVLRFMTRAVWKTPIQLALSVTAAT